MKERWPQAVLTVIGIVALWVLLTGPKRQKLPVEPSYQGRPWSYWARQLDTGNLLQARAAIRHIGTNGIPFLLKGIRQGEILPAEAIYLLKPLGAAAVPALVPAFRDHNDMVRWVAAETIVAMAPEVRANAGVVLPGLKDLVRDPSADARFSAVMALSALGSNAIPAIPALIHALQDSDAGPDGRTVYVREKAAEALGKLGPAAEAAIPVLTQCLEDSSWYMRQQSAMALWQVSRKQEPAVTVLSAMLTSPDRTIGQAAALVLLRIAAETNLNPGLMARIEAARPKRFTVARVRAPVPDELR